jgi:hypothetical protein
VNLAATNTVANGEDCVFGIEDSRDEEEAVAGWRELEKVEDGGR